MMLTTWSTSSTTTGSNTRSKEVYIHRSLPCDIINARASHHGINFPFLGADPTACATEPESTDGHGAEQADGSRYNPDTMSSSGVKKRSKAWGEFRVTEDADGKPVKAECIHCHTVVRCETTKGTSVLHNHLKSENCKRKRAAIEQTPNPRYYLA